MVLDYHHRDTMVMGCIGLVLTALVVTAVSLAGTEKSISTESHLSNVLIAYLHEYERKMLVTGC
jgi:hypothetical protein